MNQNMEISTEVIDPTPVLKTQMEGAIEIARRYPRELKAVKKAVIDTATIDSQTAESCFYSLPRGGKLIEGVSIRFAEIVAYNWEHIMLESYCVSINQKSVTAEAKAWDMQKNLWARKQVSRRITDRNGNRYNDDMINVTIQAACAVAERNALLKIIPPAVLKDCEKFIKKKAVQSDDPLAIRVKKMFNFCIEMGITGEAVLDFLKKRDQREVTEDDLFKVRTAINGIKDGLSTISEVFYPQKEETKTEGLKSGKRAVREKKKEEPEKKGGTETGDPGIRVNEETGEIIPDNGEAEWGNDEPEMVPVQVALKDLPEKERAEVLTKMKENGDKERSRRASKNAPEATQQEKSQLENLFG